MTIDELRSEAAVMSRWQRHRFMVMIAGVIAISLVMVAISLYLYNVSGAAQVDLSRPGYQSIQKEASREDTNDAAFPSSGTLDQAAYNEFLQSYDYHNKRIVGKDSFDAAALSDDSLQMFVSERSASTSVR